MVEKEKQNEGIKRWISYKELREHKKRKNGGMIATHGKAHHIQILTHTCTLV